MHRPESLRSLAALLGGSLEESQAGRADTGLGAIYGPGWIFPSEIPTLFYRLHLLHAKISIWKEWKHLPLSEAHILRSVTLALAVKL